MAQPVIFDDGGSTRIKQLKGGGVDGHLDSLIEVDATTAPAHSGAVAEGPFNKIQVTRIDNAGNATTPLLITPLAENDKFKISSGLHRVEGKIVDRSGETPPGSAKDLQITISGTGGTEPIVEARHSKGQRRYIISNAPPIEKIEVNPA